jgi:aryl carrier-like protein
MARKPLDVYIPPFNWKVLSEDVGSQAMYEHLIPDGDFASDVTVSSTDTPADQAGALEQLVLSMLNIARTDFSPLVALTRYGLDSIVAVRLAGGVRKLTRTPVTQLQLLADMSFEGLLERVRAHAAKADTN